MATWTQNDLTELEKAIAHGALRVKYRDREVTYRSMEEMLQLRALMRTELGLNPNASGRKYTSISKGTT